MKINYEINQRTCRLFREKCAVGVCDMQSINKVSWNCCESETYKNVWWWRSTQISSVDVKYMILQIHFFTSFITENVKHENITQHQTAFSLILISKQTLKASGGKFRTKNAIKIIEMFNILKLTHLWHRQNYLDTKSCLHVMFSALWFYTKSKVVWSTVIKVICLLVNI